MKIDLHIHSNASDGQHDPAEVVRLAAEAGIRKMALTDHDTLSGLQSAKTAAEICGIEFVPGIEISCELDTASAEELLSSAASLSALCNTSSRSSIDRYMSRLEEDPAERAVLLDALTNEEIHILGYYIDSDHPLLNKACAQFKQDRLDRGPKICRFLDGKGIEVDMKEVLEIQGTGSLGRPHFAQYLIRHGFVKSTQEAFDRYLDTDEFQQATARIKPTPFKAVSLIHAAGGRAVLAHPGLLGFDREMQELLTAALVQEGLNGLECFYDKHDDEQTAYYLSLREHFGLLTGCGSDFHGKLVKPDVELGMILPEEYAASVI